MPEALKSQIQFKALFEYATEGILVADNLGVIQVANPAAENLFEYDPGQLSGQKVEILIPQRHAKNHGALRDKFNIHPAARTMGIGRDLFGFGSLYSARPKTAKIRSLDGWYEVFVRELHAGRLLLLPRVFNSSALA